MDHESGDERIPILDRDARGEGEGDRDHQEAGALQVTRVGDVIVISTECPVLPPSLSETEQVIVRALLAGRSNAEIARSRGTTRKTVANQLYMLFRKLGVGTREELVIKLSSSGVSADDRPQS